MALQTDRIHNAIYAAIAAHDFPRVSYDPDTKLRATDEMDTEKAETILVRATSTAFEQAVGYRRTPRVQDRSEWVWEAEVAFDNQVELELFERELSDGAILLPRTAELNQQVTITLTAVEYTHPPQHQPSSGTRAVLTFTATLYRK